MAKLKKKKMVYIPRVCNCHPVPHTLRLGYYIEESPESGPKKVSNLGSHKYKWALVVSSSI